MSEAGSLSERQAGCYLGCGRSSERSQSGRGEELKVWHSAGSGHKREGKSLFDATAGHSYVTASEVQTSRASEEEEER